MGNELRHKDAGAKLSRTKDNAIDRHEAGGQTANDMLYFNGTSWIRATPATIRTLLSIIAQTLFDANTILKADTDNTPVALAVAASRIIGRKSSGGIAALTVAEIKTLLGVATASGIASLNSSTKVVEQPASISDFLEGTPTEDLATKAPTSEWAFDHNANPTAHQTRLQSKVKRETRDLTAAAGDVSYTGYDFTPTALIINASIVGVTTASWGYSDSAKGVHNIAQFEDGNMSASATNILYLRTGATPDRQTAIIKSYDADGHTLTYAKAGTPSGTAYLETLALR